MELGGLGFKEAKKMNKAMIAKLARRLATKQNTLCSSVLKDKYFRDTTVFHAKKHYNASWIWICIMQGVSLIHQFSCLEVGDGKLINVWTDKWIPGMEQNLLSYCGNQLKSLTLVSELLDSNTKKWNEKEVRNNFPTDIAEKILSIRIFTDRKGKMKQDTLRWLLTQNGIFTVKSMYQKLKNPSIDQTRLANVSFWKSFWKLNISQRIKIFLWKCIHNALPVRKKLGRYMKDIDLKCIFCEHECESLKHLFFECPYARSVWMLPPLVHSNHRNDNALSFSAMYSDWIAGNCNNSDIEIMATKCWLIWKERCLRIFQSKSTTTLQLALAVQRHMKFWSPLNANKNETSYHRTPTVTVTSNRTDQVWTKPLSTRSKVNFDASWIDSSSPAGFGLIQRSDT